MPNYNDVSQEKFFRQDVQQKAKVVTQDVLSKGIIMLLQLIKAVASFIGDMVKQMLGK